MNTYGPITGIICMICLVFLFFEAAFGICLGCKTYKWIYKEKAQYCPGEVCEVKSRHEIQKIKLNQALVVIGFVAFIIASVFIFNDNFIQAPSPFLSPEMEHQVK